MGYVRRVGLMDVQVFSDQEAGKQLIVLTKSLVVILGNVILSPKTRKSLKLSSLAFSFVRHITGECKMN